MGGFIMLCKNCKSVLNYNAQTLKTLDFCPICGERLIETDDNNRLSFDTARDFLVYLTKNHGNNVLLSDNFRFYVEYHDSAIHVGTKELILQVHDKGAAAILQNYADGNRTAKEFAINQAVTKLIDSNIEPDIAEGIIGEYVNALGWQVGITPYLSNNNITSEILDGKIRNIQFGRYKWRAIYRIDNSFLLLTEDIIEKQPYDFRLNEHDTSVESSWETCSLRRYLNNEFISLFNAKDQSVIENKENENSANGYAGGSGGNPTTDIIFVLGPKEVMSYLGVHRDSVKEYNLDNQRVFNDDYNYRRISTYNGAECWWWLRTTGSDNTKAAFIGADGSICLGGCEVNNSEGGIRPALWLRL